MAGPLGACGALLLIRSPIEIDQLADQGGAAMERRCGARSTGIFPLGLTGKAVVAACAFTQLGAERHGLLPAHPLYRMLVSLGPIALKFGSIDLHHLPPLGLGDRGLAHPEALQLHQVLGAFIV